MFLPPTECRKSQAFNSGNKIIDNTPINDNLFIFLVIGCNKNIQKVYCFEINYIFAVIYGILGSVGAVFGDLSFSVIKRQTGIKDYGNLIPGHGGILDRFDSMMVVGPLAEILLILLPLTV